MAKFSDWEQEYFDLSKSSQKNLEDKIDKIISAYILCSTLDSILFTEYIIW